MRWHRKVFENVIKFRQAGSSFGYEIQLDFKIIHEGVDSV
jgi:hypothetical protein